MPAMKCMPAILMRVYRRLCCRFSQSHTNPSLYNVIARIVVEARATAYRNNNAILLKMYWEISKLIIEDEQKGAARAEYGKAVLKNLAVRLAIEFGRGFDFTNLTNMRKFFSAFPIFDAVRQELSWTHYRIITGVLVLVFW
jgi:DUF1016 N-terminal domain